MTGTRPTWRYGLPYGYLNGVVAVISVVGTVIMLAFLIAKLMIS